MSQVPDPERCTGKSLEIANRQVCLSSLGQKHPTLALKSVLGNVTSTLHGLPMGLNVLVRMAGSPAHALGHVKYVAHPSARRPMI